MKIKNITSVCGSSMDSNTEMTLTFPSCYNANQMMGSLPPPPCPHHAHPSFGIIMTKAFQQMFMACLNVGGPSPKSFKLSQNPSKWAKTLHK